MEELDVLVRNIQADAKRIRLLDILDQQFRLLITGKPDLDVKPAEFMKGSVRRGLRELKADLYSRIEVTG